MKKCSDCFYYKSCVNAKLLIKLETSKEYNVCKFYAERK